MSLALTQEQRQSWFRRLAAIVFLGIASYSFLRSYVYRAPRIVDVAALQLQTLDGMPLPRTAVAGRAVLLNFWAPWCPPCREEIPSLESLQQANPEIAVVGIEDDPDAVQQARALAQAKAISYLLALPNPALRSALGHVPSLPTTLYISASGHVIHTVTGVVPESVMRQYLSDTLASP